MKYIKTYQNNAAYELDKPNMEAPHVGYIEATDEVKYINDMADLYDIYGTVTDGTSSMKIKINNVQQNATVSNGKLMYNWTGGTITTLTEAFYQKNIVSVNKFDLDTSSVSSLGSMFYGCENLVSFDFSNFNTTNLVNMYTMFFNCLSITSLDLSNFNTSGVTTTNGTFLFCRNMRTLNISNWDMSNVTNTANMFNGDSSLQIITMNNTNQTTFDMIKAQLVTDSVASHVTIIRDGHSYQYQNGQWVEV